MVADFRAWIQARPNGAPVVWHRSRACMRSKLTRPPVSAAAASRSRSSVRTRGVPTDGFMSRSSMALRSGRFGRPTVTVWNPGS